MNKCLERIHWLTGRNKIEFLEHTNGYRRSVPWVASSCQLSAFRSEKLSFLRVFLEARSWKLGKHFVDDAVFYGLFRRHEEVAVHVGSDFLHFLPCIFREDFVQPFTQFQNLFGGNLNVRRHTFGTAARLVNHHFRIRERETLAFLSGGEKYGGPRSGHADTHRGYVGLNVIHRVQNGEPGRDVPAGGVDVKGDVFLRVLRGEEEKLCHDEVGGVAIYRTAEEDDALLQEARVNVVCALAHGGLLDDHRYKHLRTCCARLRFRGIHIEGSVQKYLCWCKSNEVFRFCLLWQIHKLSCSYERTHQNCT